MDRTNAISQLLRLGWSDVRELEPSAAIARMKAIYDRSIGGLQEAIQKLSAGAPPETVDVSWNYPGLAFAAGNEKPNIPSNASYGFCRRGAGLYVTTVARPDIFESYWMEQIEALIRSHGGLPFVGVSSQQIPPNLGLDGVGQYIPANIEGYFPRTSLEKISRSARAPRGTYRLSAFSGPMTEFCLARLKHYTGTGPEHFQRFILLTNYAMYMETFAAMAKDLVGKDGYTEFVGPPVLEGKSRKVPQMPAYHLKRADGLGMTMININVGPSNALNITRNLCALRPHALLMVGHCGGLRPTQHIGGFVLADGYYREDRIMDEIVPRSIPIPPIAEINIALNDAMQEVYGKDREAIRQFVETGTVASVDDRGWELRSKLLRRITKSRALAIDMESATIAAAGFQYRVPYGTLLCISDLPLHGKPKQQGIAHSLYETAVDVHLDIVMKAVEKMRANPERLHSRRLQEVFSPPAR